LPEKLKAQYVMRLAELITEGMVIAASIREIPGKMDWGRPSVEPDWDRRRLAKWRINCLTLLEPFGRQGTRLRDQLDFFAQVGGTSETSKAALAYWRRFAKTWRRGF
jgi:hypothetical protein